MYYAENKTERILELQGHNILTIRAQNCHFQFNQKSDERFLNLRIEEHVRAKTREKADIYMSQFDYLDETQNLEKVLQVVEPVVDKDQNEAEWLFIQTEVPSGIDFNLHQMAGHVACDGFESRLVLNGGQGNVDLFGMRGEVNVALENGNIYIDSVSGNVSALSRKGNVVLRSALDGCEKLEVEIGMGNIDLYIPSERSFSIDASTHGGEVVLQVAMDEITHYSRSKLIGNNRGGGTRIELKVREIGSILIQDFKYIPERRWYLDISHEGQ